MSQPNRSARERLLLAILPAVLISMIYGWFLLPRIEAEREEALAALESARKGEVDPVAAQRKAIAVRRLRAEEARLREASASASRQRETLRESLGRAANRAETIERIAGCCATHGLRLVEEGPPKGANVPRSVQSALEVVVGPATVRARTVWEVRIEGAYADVLAALDEICGESERVVLPISISMERPEAGPGGAPRPLQWRILLWM